MVPSYFGGYKMHRSRNNLLIYGGTVLAGVSSLALHRYMMENCFDEKGLLITGNLPGWLLLVIGTAFLVGMTLLLRTLGGSGTYEDNFPRDTLSGVLLIAAGAVMFWSASQPDTVAGPAVQVTTGTWVGAMTQLTDRCKAFLPWLAAASMMVLGLYRLQGKRSPVWFSGAVCLNYMLTLITDYRLWSADPQVQDYAYQLLAEVLLMLCAFHRTSCDGGILQRKKLIFTGMAAALCSTASLSMDFHRSFFLASFLWGLGCVCSTAVLPPDPEDDDEEPEKTEAAEE